MTDEARGAGFGRFSTITGTVGADWLGIDVAIAASVAATAAARVNIAGRSNWFGAKGRGPALCCCGTLSILDATPGAAPSVTTLIGRGVTIAIALAAFARDFFDGVAPKHIRASAQEAARRPEREYQAKDGP